MKTRDGKSNSTRLRRLRAIRGPLAVGRPQKVFDVRKVQRSITAFERSGMPRVQATETALEAFGVSRSTWFRRLAQIPDSGT